MINRRHGAEKWILRAVSLKDYCRYDFGIRGCVILFLEAVCCIDLFRVNEIGKGYGEEEV